MKNPTIKITFLTVLFLMMVSVYSCRIKKPLGKVPDESLSTSIEKTSNSIPNGDGNPNQNPDKREESGNNDPDAAVKETAFSFQNILFEFNSSIIKTSSYSILDEIATEIKKFPDVKFQLNGHSSSEGPAEYNMSLSIDRANAIKKYLSNFGVSANNLFVKGFGESMPINSNNIESDRQLNRRVEIRKL